MHKILTTLTVFCMLIAGVTQISCSTSDKGAEKKAEAKTETKTKMEVEISNTQPPAELYQTTDALSGKTINRNIYEDYEGKRVYFCCRNSKKTFLDDPSIYLDKFKELGVTLQDAPAPDANE